MSDYIVLVKQVPDVSQVTDNAFNPDTGTLVRGRLQNVINELDTQALAFAQYMLRISGDSQGRVICLTMGPPAAEEVLKYGLSRCADLAVLLTDRALGGADTVATANPLAFAIRKIQREILGGKNDFFVLAGMQSVDGDTAQVPPQIAEELGVGCVAYLTDVEYKEGHFEFSRIISGGTQVVQPTKMPVVLTVAKYEFPLFAGFAATRRAQATKVIQWGANDIQASQVGAKGSKTQVIRVFPPGKTTRKCQRIEKVSELAKIIAKSYSGGESHAAGKVSGPNYLLPGKRATPFDRSFEWIEKDRATFKLVAEHLEQAGLHDFYDLDEEVKEKLSVALSSQLAGKALDEMLEGMRTFKPVYQGAVFVMAEQSQGVLSPATFELTGKARELADSLETEVGVVLAGDSVSHLTDSLIKAGADKVHIVEHPSLKEFDPVSYRKAVTEIVAANWPQIMLFAATPAGRVLAPMVSYRLGCGLTADCTSLDIKDNSRKGQIGILLQTRPALGGNVMATISTKDSRCQMATARPGVLKKLPPDANRRGEVVRYEPHIEEVDHSLKFIKTEVAQSSNVNLEAEVIVSGGKGLQNRDNYLELLHSLSDALSKRLGTQVEKGASRSAVEQGFTERARQVGQTGTSVGPKLYVALGISGAIQHMIGVSKSETIVAVNMDPDAPIFKQCDYYMVGNVEKVVPELVKALEAV